MLQIERSLTFREAFGLRGLLVRIIVFFVLPGLITFGLIAAFLGFHAKAIMFGIGAWLIVIAFLTFVVMIVRFANAVTEKSLKFLVPLERVCEAIPSAIATTTGN